MGTSRSDVVATFDAFNQLEHGMSYEHVCKIIGCEGNLLFRIGGMGGVPETAMFSWNGAGIAGANMNATFREGKLTSKAQFGMDQRAHPHMESPAVQSHTRDRTAASDER